MRKLKLLVIHNYYQQPAGEDAVVRAEIDMLRRKGHKVTEFSRHNGTIESFNPLRKAALALTTTWNQSSYSEVQSLIAKERPDLAHCHNLFPLVSPSVYWACRSARVPVVQTLHNYRLFCPAGTFYRNDRTCSDCTQSLGYGIIRGCYRASRVQTATVAAGLAFHRMLGTCNRSVAGYIALSQSGCAHFVELGINKQKVYIKPNFSICNTSERKNVSEYALFVGRLSPEKGVLEMLEAWRGLSHVPLAVVGDGPLRRTAESRIRNWKSSHIRLLGSLEPGSVLTMMQGARFLVFPSRWDERFGMTLVEASACGVPAIAATVGSVPEIVEHHRTGLLFHPNKFEELAAQAKWAWEHPEAMKAMGAAARQRYLQHYTAETNYELLMEIYSSVLASQKRPYAYDASFKEGHGI